MSSPEDDVILGESWDFLKAENLPPCPRCGQQIEAGKWIISDGGHHICSEPSAGVVGNQPKEQG